MRPNVLLIEDSPEIQIVVRAAIQEFCDLRSVGKIADAEIEIAARTYDLLILDIGLPDGDGFEFCKTIRTKREFKNLPVIVLTGLKEIEDRVKGFEIGADDYVVKPLEPREFAARVRSKLRRSKEVESQTSFQLAGFTVHLKTQKAAMFSDELKKNQELNLTPIEFKLLVHFLKNQGTVFSREELVTEVWGEDVHVSGHTVDTHISSLRKKIGPAAQHLRSVVKKGYCFTLN